MLPGKEVDLSAPLLGSNNCHEAIDNTCINTDNSTNNQLLDKGYLKYGCTHVPRRCRIRAPCCNEIFNCRHCHDELKNNLDKDGHKMPRKQTYQLICSLCNTEQEFQQICINCGVCMGRYFCGICKVVTGDPSKTIYHCLSCGACCRAKPELQPSHCNKCQCCREKTHTCIQGVLHRDCPICFEYLIETPGPFSTLPCGHMMHNSCLLKLNRYTDSSAFSVQIDLDTLQYYD
ncbi:E3 ubiquitin-protein like [Heracleum sosnowskyi]|uniref:E3 ubiquitin-protein like n=1 Tax=Heracleum sosnowskyi TaxID=360622 RepID=A0AAD8GPP8_9APIA|nr:E3 ubiquitin-protein like [Heracleum sosnowskyi]KAK1352213.1 E3 ubiquitin-protein like [Heracleum sosnowskyi]